MCYFICSSIQANVTAILDKLQRGYDKRVRPNYGGKSLDVTLIWNRIYKKKKREVRRSRFSSFYREANETHKSEIKRQRVKEEEEEEAAASFSTKQQELDKFISILFWEYIKDNKPICFLDWQLDIDRRRIVVFLFPSFTSSFSAAQLTFLFLALLLLLLLLYCCFFLLTDGTETTATDGGNRETKKSISFVLYSAFSIVLKGKVLNTERKRSSHASISFVGLFLSA